ncbi:MAG: hypothetical protein HY815_14930 [Candidatus Riflebacteria bacterium]|nr:hypothetical protein [Candidatus Riflebacteria bacterium]
MAKTKYRPTFAEETLITYCYGTDDEIEYFHRLMLDTDDRGNLVNLIILIEWIKCRHGLGMNWDCCWRCQRVEGCEINWFRGERAIPKTCCPNCMNYGECNRNFQDQLSGKSDS